MTSNEESSEKIELSLGLSLNGKFGVEKSDKNKLMKALSINIARASLPIFRDDSISLSPPFSHPTVRRTCSVPTKIKENGRRRKELQRMEDGSKRKELQSLRRMEDGSKRKELQTLRRMEAKLRQSEKQRNSRTDKDGGGGGGCLEPICDEKCEIETILKGKTVKEKYIEPVNRFNSSVMPPFLLPSRAALEAEIHAEAKGKGKGKGKENYMGGSGDGMQWFGRRSSLSSIESAMEELMESKSLQGTSSSCGEASYASFQSMEMETDSETSQNQEREAMLNAMKEMPRVSTRRDLPNGRQVEGILYKYGIGDEIIIMCICHGSFLNPAEFVKHAGAAAVANPLKHIVVRPNASFFSQMKS